MKKRSFPRVCQTGRTYTRAAALIHSLILLLVCTGLAGAPAYAAGGRQAETHKVEFNQSKIEPMRILDWRSPVAVLDFDVPDNDWVDDIELLVSARPQGTVSKTTPLLVRFNDAAPIPLQTEGHGFDARITLDRRHMRAERNHVSFEYQTPAEQACLGPGHGAWDIDIKSSAIVIKSRSKLQAYNFHDVRGLLTSDSTRPKSVTIWAKGDNTAKLETLAAQGIARNIGNIPQFRLGDAAADLTIIAAPRQHLGRRVTDNDIVKSSGPQIAVADARPVKIVLTGDTDAEVMAAVKAFSSAVLPDSRLRKLSPTRFLATPSIFDGPKRISGKTPLTELGARPFTPGWAPRPQHLAFDVEDPAASFGKIDLRLQAGPFLDPTSTIDVAINGHALTSITLDKTKIRAVIDIPRGVLKGLDNTLILTPQITPSAAQPECSISRIGPGLGLGAKSSISIARDSLSDAADLSSFTASGAPFADHKGRGATVILSTQSRRERASALRVMAQLGRASGQGWTEANIVNAGATPWPVSGHVLVIGSQIGLDAPEMSHAPRSLKVAVSGGRYNDRIVKKSASLEGPLPVLLNTQRSLTGGVAALYRDRSARVVGIVTQTKGQSFNIAVDDLLETGNWNELEGSVARWNRTKVAMTQTALPPHILKPKTPAIFSKIKFPDMTRWEIAVSNKWHGLVQKLQQLWERPEATAMLPPESRSSEKPHKATSVSGVPTPRLKPTRHQSATFGDRPIAVPKAPREDIFPKIDMWLAGMNAKIESGYSTISESVSGAVKATPFGAHPAHESAKPKLLIFALAAIVLLIMAVFISPAKIQTRHDN